jgi:hypothetical protein
MAKPGRIIGILETVLREYPVGPLSSVASNARNLSVLLDACVSLICRLQGVLRRSKGVMTR